MGVVCLTTWFWVPRTQCVDQASLELTRSSCLCHSSAGVKVMYHHMQPFQKPLYYTVCFKISFLLRRCTLKNSVIFHWQQVLLSLTTGRASGLNLPSAHPSPRVAPSRTFSSSSFQELRVKTLQVITDVSPYSLPRSDTPANLINSIFRIFLESESFVQSLLTMFPGQCIDSSSG